MAYRSLCSTTFCAPLCVSEMVTAGTLLTNSREALRIASFAEHEPVRSVQLYGVRPEQVSSQSPAPYQPTPERLASRKMRATDWV